MAQQNENSSQLEPILRWGTSIAKWAAVGLGTITLATLVLRGRRLPQGAQFAAYSTAAVAFWLLNKEMGRVLDSVSG